MTIPKCKTTLLVVLVASSVFSGCASLPGTALSSATASGMDCTVAGAGAPVVVFESGIGETLNTWDKVFPEVARLTTVFAYTRRGYSGSGPAPRETDGETAVRELRALLADRHLRPPYVLVGHSLGGLYVELFAKLHPDEVAGVVLVDPTPVDHMDRLHAEFPGKYAMLRTIMTLQAESIAMAEQRGIDATSRAWHAAGPFPACPMIVLTGVKASLLEDAAMIDYKVRTHAELLPQWPGAEGRRVESGHFIQRDKPEAVIAAIRDLLKTIPAKQPALTPQESR